MQADSLPGGGISLPAAPSLAPRARVVVVEDAGNTRNLQPDLARVRACLDRGLTNLTGHATPQAAWQSLLAPQDVIGLKVLSGREPNVGTRPAVAQAVAESLLAARFPPRQILIWDRQMEDLRQAGFVELASRLGIGAVGAVQAGWDHKVFYEVPLLGNLVHGDLEFDGKDEKAARKSHVTKLLTSRITRIINISPLLNHNSCGVSGNLYSLAFGSVDNVRRFEGETSRMAQALPEIYALPALGDRVALNIVDALIVQYHGQQLGHLHYSAVLNQLRLSTDPVALDVLSLEELDRQRERSSVTASSNTNVLEIYRNASLLEIGISDPRRIEVEDLR